MNFRYSLTDEQIRLAYYDILAHLKTEDIRDTDYHEDLALIMAQINALLSETTETEDFFSANVDKWKFILDAIKLKAVLVKENRLERERREKAIERQMKLDSIPIDDYRNAIAAVIGVVSKYVPLESMNKVITELTDITSNLNNQKSSSN